MPRPVSILLGEKFFRINRSIKTPKTVVPMYPALDVNIAPKKPDGAEYVSPLVSAEIVRL
jgi:hypothetical protein